MKKIVFGLLLIVLIVMGVFVFSITRSFNADSYKTQIISSLEKLTGRHVSCADEVTLSWRPQPTFIMNDLVISNQDGSNVPNMLSVKQVQVEMDWSSFLRPSLVIKKVILKNPNVLVERLHSYQTNFTFPYLFNPEQTLDNDSIIGDVPALVVNDFEIVDGSVTYHNDLTSNTFVLNKVSGHGRMDSLNGPFEFDGSANTESYTFDTNLVVNKLNVSQPITGTLLLKNSSGNTQINAGYSLSTNKGDDWLVFEGSYSSQNPTELFDRLNVKWPDLGEAKGYFKWVVNPKDNILKEFVMVQGGGENTVSCNIIVKPDEKEKQDKLSFTMDKLDYTLWQDVLSKLLSILSKKSDSSLLVDISVGRLFWNNQNISDMLIQGKMNAGILDGNLSAQLPFDGSFSLNGQYQLSQKIVKGETNIQTQDLFAFVQWILGENPSWLPSVEKVSSQWTAKVDISNAKKVADIHLGTIADTKISGTIEKASGILKTDLKIQDLNVDAYYPHLENMNNQAIQNWLSDMIQISSDSFKNGQIRLDLSNISILKKTFQHILLNGKWSDSVWNIERAELNNENDITVQFSGQIRQLGKPDFNFNSAQLNFDIPNWDKWQDFLWLSNLDAQLKKFSSVSGFINYSGDAKAGTIKMETTLDKLKLDLSGQVSPTLYSLDETHLSITHSDFSQLVKFFQPEKVWTADWAIPVSFNGVVSKNSQKITWKTADVSLGKNSFKTSGQLSSDLLDLNIQADQLDLSIVFPSFKNLDQTWMLPSNWVNTRLDVSSDRFIYDNIHGTRLKLKASSQKQKWTITGLDCLVGDERPGRFSLDGTMDINKQIQADLHLEWDKIQTDGKSLNFGSYRFAEGEFSGNAQIKSNGNSWRTLTSNATGQGRMTWTDGVLYGVDASAWLAAVQSALAAEQMGQGFSSRLQYALTNGKTNLPNLEGTFTLGNGSLNFKDIRGANDLVTLSDVSLDWVLNKDMTHIKMPIILTAISKLPAVIFDFNYNAYSIQSIPFEQSFDEELKLKNRQSAEARQLQNLKATELKNQQMRSEAQNIMNNMEQTLKQLQERVAFHSDREANRKLDDLNYTAREIRDLAVKVDLTPADYAALLEKARLWAVQVTDLNNFYARQDLLNQKVKTNQLSPMVGTYLANIEQIYQQHPQSVILAEIVMNSRKVASLIKDDEVKLSTAQDASTVQSIIIRIQDNFDKIEKAHQYAQKLHLSLMNGGVSL